ncbi:MAG: DNA polymerase Y family protein [Arenimonas sp.]|nr:DNA polymerase Y family protein [Arenimonas sp.]
MLWACILLPQLALDGVSRAGTRKELPLALITGPAQRRVLLDANAAARAAGLYPGQPLLAAQALLQDFQAIDHDPREDERLRRFLAAWAYRYSSMVSLEGEDAIVLEVERSLGLFGPWPRLERMLRDDLRELGFQHRIAMASTALGACVLAAAQDGLALTETTHLRHSLGRVPITQARIGERDATTLAAMGLRQLRQLFALPRAGLARRFGPGLLEHLDRMTGDHPDPRELYQPPDVFDERIELNYEVSHHPALLFPIRRLVNDLAAYLAGRDGGVQRFVIALEHEPDSATGDPDAVRNHAAGKLPDTEVVVGLLAAERDPARLFDLARSRLERASIPAPVRALRLVARELPPFVPAGRDLFDDRPAQALPWEALRERLRARLGEDALYQLANHPDPRPEQSLRRSAQLIREPDALLLPPRPTWLLPRPMPLRDHSLQILAGPERIESGWWDGGDVRRDYYVVQTSLGQRAWAFLPAGVSDGAWMLHGWFA